MNRAEFEQVIAEEFPNAVPEKFRTMVKNVAFLIEEEPSWEVRQEEGLRPNETLLGLYRGVPRAMRGDYYGVGPTVPDVIILYRMPIHEEAREEATRRALEPDSSLRAVVRETIWHEVAHYLGMGEEAVRARESERHTAAAAPQTAPETPPEAPRHGYTPKTGEPPDNLPKLLD